MAEQHTPPGEHAGNAEPRLPHTPRDPASPAADGRDPAIAAWLSAGHSGRTSEAHPAAAGRWLSAAADRKGLERLPGHAGGTVAPLPRRLGPLGLPGLELLLACGLALVLLLGPIGVAPAWAAELRVSEVRLEPCPAEDAGSQPELRRPSGASCYALRGLVTNPGRQPVVDTDVFALILDSSGEPVLPNRSRVGSIGDVPPGESAFALRLAVPAGTPGPFEVRNARARGFKSPVRSRAAEGEELLPLEQAVADS